MRLADAEALMAELTTRIPGTTATRLWQGPRGYCLLGTRPDGRAFEVRRKSDLAKIAPKKRRRR